jgi:hypothetical protein
MNYPKNQLERPDPAPLELRHRAVQDSKDRINRASLYLGNLLQGHAPRWRCWSPLHGIPSNNCGAEPTVPTVAGMYALKSMLSTL